MNSADRKGMRCWLYIFSISPFVLSAQVDTLSGKTYRTPEVTVTGERSKDFSTGQRIQYADSAGLSNRISYSLAEQLGYGNAVFIKSYGANGLATLSLQGSADVHSAVVWNGFNLQSAMLGSVDLSLMPSFFSDEVGIQSGSASHLWGSGAVGGSVILNNKPQFSKGLQIKSNTEKGSYDQFRQQLKLAYGSKNSYTSVKGFYSEARNDYPITHNDPSITKLGHAATQQKGILVEQYYRWKIKNQLTARLWLQDDYRQNPTDVWRGTLYHNFRRANLEYNRQMYKHRLVARSAWLREDLLFIYPLLQQDTRSIADVLISEVEWQWSPWRTHHFTVGANNTYQQASVKVVDYGTSGDVLGTKQDKYHQSTPQRNRASLFGIYKYQSMSEVLAVQLSARKEWTPLTLIPLVPALGIDVKPLKGVLLKASVSRMYRIPTFNELYWDPGGNPNILPESGWSMELSARLSKKIKKISGFYELAHFNKKIENWIRWVPNGPVWYAQNVAKVWTRGFEHKAGLTYQKGKSKLQTKATLLYVVSTNEQSSLQNDASVGLQLLFTPMYQSNGNVTYAYGGFYIEYNHSYTGYNYLSSDHSTWLVPFHLGNLTMSQALPVKRIKTSLILRINNVWNTEYRTMAAYPMPPLHYELALQLDFTTTKTQK